MLRRQRQPPENACAKQHAALPTTSPLDSPANRRSPLPPPDDARALPPQLPPRRARSSVGRRLSRLLHHRSTTPARNAYGRTPTTPPGDRTIAPLPSSAERSASNRSAGCGPIHGAAAPPSGPLADRLVHPPGPAPQAAAAQRPTAPAPVRRPATAPAVTRAFVHGARRTPLAIAGVRTLPVGGEVAPRSSTHPAGAARRLRRPPSTLPLPTTTRQTGRAHTPKRRSRADRRENPATLMPNTARGKKPSPQ